MVGEPIPLLKAIARDGSARLYRSDYVGDANLHGLVSLQGLDLTAVARN